VKNLHSLKIKIIVPLLIILIIVFFTSSLIIIDREYRVARDTLIENSESFSSLSVGTLINDYELYYQSGFLKFSEIIDGLIQLNNDIESLEILDVNGKILFDYIEIQEGKYDEQQHGSRYYTDPTLINRAISLSPSTIINQSTNQIDIVQPYFTEWGRHDYSVRFYFSMTNLDIMTNEMYTTLFIYSGIFIIVSFALIFILFNRFITTPIADLMNGVRSMSEGKLGKKLKIRTKDELGELAQSFNTMSFELKKSQDSLKEYSENLELLVTKRTEELEDKTANLEKINEDLEITQKELDFLNKTLEKRIKERTKEVEFLLKQKDEFINQLSHDLKSPLMPLTILIPLLEKEKTNSKRLEYIQVLKRNVEYMKNIAIKTLELAKLNSPKTKFVLEKIDLYEITQEIISNKSTLFSQKNLQIINNIQSQFRVNADKLRLEELLSNLLENAVKYSYENGTITFNAIEERDYVKVSLKDTGMGLNKKQIKHIFEEFYKADSSRHDFDSSGLGLAICKKIIERHNGTIWAESQGLEKGTTIYFTIPKYKMRDKQSS
jgi:signal transduction histidine kinase